MASLSRLSCYGCPVVVVQCRYRVMSVLQYYLLTAFEYYYPIAVVLACQLFPVVAILSSLSFHSCPVRSVHVAFLPSPFRCRCPVKQLPRRVGMTAMCNNTTGIFRPMSVRLKIIPFHRYLSAVILYCDLTLNFIVVYYVSTVMKMHVKFYRMIKRPDIYEM
jgi:hypothetical protein